MTYGLISTALFAAIVTVGCRVGHYRETHDDICALVSLPLNSGVLKRRYILERAAHEQLFCHMR